MPPAPSSSALDGSLMADNEAGQLAAAGQMDDGAAPTTESKPDGAEDEKQQDDAEESSKLEAAPDEPAFASTLRPPPPAASPFARPTSYPSALWPEPPLSELRAPGGVPRVQAQLDALPSGSRDRFARWVLGVASVEHYEGSFGPSGLYHGFGRARFKGGASYVGQFHSGLMHGEGEYTWPDGCVYRGTLHEQAVTGQGRLEWPDGAWYAGDVREGHRHGEGTFVDPNVPVAYEGTWEQGLRHGNGKLSYALDNEDQTGSERHFYEGQFVQGARHGYGLLRYASGNLYEGEFVWDRKVGRGTMQWFTRNQRYDGEWLNDQPHGQGEYTWLDLPAHSAPALAVGSGARGAASLSSHASPSPSSSGATASSTPSHFQHPNRYVGSFVQGVREGRGALFYSNGSVYDGMWSGNRKHGQGRFVFANGSEYVGAFVDDQMQDASKWMHPYTGVAEQMAALSLGGEQQPPPSSPSRRNKKTVGANPAASAKDIGVFDLPLTDVFAAHAREQGFVPGSPATDQSAAQYVSQQREQVSNLLLRYNSELLDVYRYYASADVEMAQPERVDIVLPYTPLSPTTAPAHLAQANSAAAAVSTARMNLAQLWLLINDLGLIGRPELAHVDLSLAAIDRLVLRRMQLGCADAHALRLLHGIGSNASGGPSSLHDPRHVLLHRDFLEALVRLADEVYRVPPGDESDAEGASVEQEKEQPEEKESSAAAEDQPAGDIDEDAASDDVQPSVLYARAQANFNLILNGGGNTAAAQSTPATAASPSAADLSLPLHALASLQISTPGRPVASSPSGVFSPGSTAVLSPAGGVQGARMMQFGATTALSPSSTALLQKGAPGDKGKLQNTLAARLKRFLLEIVLPRAKTRSKNIINASSGHNGMFGGAAAPLTPQPLYRLPAIVAMLKRFERELYVRVFLPHAQQRPAILPVAVSVPDKVDAVVPLPPLSDRTMSLGALLRLLQASSASAAARAPRVLTAHFNLYHCLDVLFGPVRSALADARLHLFMPAELLFEELLDTLVRLALYRGRVLAEVAASMRAEAEAVEAIRAERRERAEAEARRIAEIEAAEAEAAAAAAAQAAADAEAKGKPGAKAAMPKSGSSTAPGSTPASKPPSASSKKAPAAAAGKDKDSGAGAAPLDKAAAKRASLGGKAAAAADKGKAGALSPRSSSSKKKLASGGKASAAAGKPGSAAKKGASLKKSSSGVRPGSSAGAAGMSASSSAAESPLGPMPTSSRGQLLSGSGSVRKGVRRDSNHLTSSSESLLASEGGSGSSVSVGRLSLADSGATGAWSLSEEQSTSLCGDVEVVLLALLGKPRPAESDLRTSYPRDMDQEPDMAAAALISFGDSA